MKSKSKSGKTSVNARTTGSHKQSVPDTSSNSGDSVVVVDKPLTSKQKRQHVENDGKEGDDAPTMVKDEMEQLSQ